MSELFIILEALFCLIIHTTLLLCIVAFWVGLLCGAGWLMVKTFELLFCRGRS